MKLIPQISLYTGAVDKCFVDKVCGTFTHFPVMAEMLELCPVFSSVNDLARRRITGIGFVSFESNEETNDNRSKNGRTLQ